MCASSDDVHSQHAHSQSSSDETDGASMNGASAELAIVGVNREVSQSGFLLGVYRCLHFLGFCKFGAGFNASSILQVEQSHKKQPDVCHSDDKNC